MSYGHGGRRERAGRPRGAVDHRSLPFGALTAGLARKYGEEALNTLVAIMRDTRAPATAQIDAASEILNRGEGRPQRSNEPLEEPAPPSASPESPRKSSPSSSAAACYPSSSWGSMSLDGTLLPPGGGQTFPQ